MGLLRENQIGIQVKLIVIKCNLNLAIKLLDII